MTNQSGSGGIPTGSAGGVLGGSYPNPSFATNGATPILGVVLGTLAASVTMTTASTFYDGPTVTLTAGTWLVFAKGSVYSASGVATDQVGFALRQGTTILASDDAQGLSSATPARGVIVATLTPTGSTVYTLSAETGRAGAIYEANSVYAPVGAGTSAAFILALRIA